MTIWAWVIVIGLAGTVLIDSIFKTIITKVLRGVACGAIGIWPSGTLWLWLATEDRNFLSPESLIWFAIMSALLVFSINGFVGAIKLYKAKKATPR
ncbi:MAG: hypothetical protein Q7S28_00110 [bacterium]|nr:hypothetical protein [bacterium]